MKKEVIENNGREPINYLRDRQWELKAALRKKFSPETTEEIVSFLKTTDFLVVKRVPAIPARTY